MVSAFNKSNRFDLTHERLQTMEMGKLYPNMLMEVVPGDIFDVKSESFCRFEAMIAPQLSRIDMFQYYFYVPYRILFDNWEKYITGGFDGKDETVKPYMMSPADGGYKVGSLADYFGIPLNVPNLKHSALPFRAMQKIFMDWFANENLMDIVEPSLADGLDTTTNTELYYKCWEKDFYTSSFPTPQRGPASYLPIGTSAPVIGNGMTIGLTDGVDNKGLTYSDLDSYGTVDAQNSKYGTPTGTTGVVATQGSSHRTLGLTTDPTKSGIWTDLTKATALPVTQVRVAFQIQRFLEKNMRGAARLVEWTLSHFGVRIPDGRLQRSEYLGGRRSPVVVSAVEQTSATVDNETPQGNLAGRGVSLGRITGFKKSFVEQGVVIGLCCFMPRTMYSQGLHRMWSRDTRYEEYLPVFAHLGEQEIKNKEIFAQGIDIKDDAGNVVDDQTFGYIDRFSELRHLPSTVHGLFRPGESLNYWTLCRQFDSLPKLNSDFVKADPSNRIFAVTDLVDHIEAQFLHHITAIRPLPKYGTPGLIDHD